MAAKFIQSLTIKLHQPLPGINAQKQMIVTPQVPLRGMGSPKKRIPASVLILLFFKNSVWYFF